jgi:MFS family permease
MSSQANRSGASDATHQDPDAWPPSRPADRPLRRNRDFMVLWVGQVVSTVGMRASALAYPLLVLALTHSPLKAGLAGSAQSVPFLLLYLPAGALVDRWDRKRVMLSSDGARAVLAASIVVTLALGQLTFPQIILVVFLDGSCFAFFQLAESAALPHIVPRNQLPTAWAQNQARELGAELAGQPLGGALFAVSHLLPFAADGISYVLSFISLLFVRPRLQHRRDRPRRNLFAEVAEGMTWLWHQPLLRIMVMLVGATNLVLNALPLAMIVRARQLGAGPGLIGVLLGLSGAAGIAGAIVAPWLQRRLRARLIIMGSLWGWAVTTVVLAWMPTPLALGATVAVGALAGPAFNVVLGSYRYALAPDRLQARTVSSARLISWGTIPLASLLAGGLMQGTGTRQTLVILGAIMVVVASAATAHRIVRNAPQVADLQPTELAVVPRGERDFRLSGRMTSSGHAKRRLRILDEVVADRQHVKATAAEASNGVAAACSRLRSLRQAPLVSCHSVHSRLRPCWRWRAWSGRAPAAPWGRAAGEWPRGRIRRSRPGERRGSESSRRIGSNRALHPSRRGSRASPSSRSGKRRPPTCRPPPTPSGR